MYFNCPEDISLVRSCKLFNDGNSLLIGGESSTITVADLNCGGTPKMKVSLSFLGVYCFLIKANIDFVFC